MVLFLKKILKSFFREPRCSYRFVNILRTEDDLNLLLLKAIEKEARDSKLEKIAFSVDVKNKTLKLSVLPEKNNVFFGSYNAISQYSIHGNLLKVDSRFEFGTLFRYLISILVLGIVLFVSFILFKQFDMGTMQLLKGSENFYQRVLPGLVVAVFIFFYAIRFMSSIIHKLNIRRMKRLDNFWSNYLSS